MHDDLIDDFSIFAITASIFKVKTSYFHILKTDQIVKPNLCFSLDSNMAAKFISQSIDDQFWCLFKLADHLDLHSGW